MKFKQIIFGLAVMVFSNTMTIAQNTTTLVKSGSIEIPKNTEPCLSNADREALYISIENNVEQLRRIGKLQPIDRALAHPLFIWPLVQDPNFDFNSFGYPYNYIDHDPEYPFKVIDYDCGNHSYDTANGYNHSGFDIVPWPFWWKQMERNQAINVAAADGQIIVKQDGHFDRNCTFNNGIWNGIVLQHSDGSRSFYLHMKSGSLTSKGIGDYVTQGEFLGIIGSSGSSTVPHLHFEVRNSANQPIDPSSGPCNNWNNDSWWVSQKPYLAPGVMAVLTHDAFPIFPSCPQIEVTNEKNQFDIRVPYYLGIYLKNGERTTNFQFKVIRPDNSIFFQWTYAVESNEPLAYYIFSGNSDMEGVWTLEATYQGDTATHNYYIGQLDIAENELVNTIIFPNPGNSEINIVSDQQITQASFVDVLGRIIFEINASNGIKNIDVTSFSEGLYFVKLTSDTNKTKTLKFVKK